MEGLVLDTTNGINDDTCIYITREAYFSGNVLSAVLISNECTNIGDIVLLRQHMRHNIGQNKCAHASKSKFLFAHYLITISIKHLRESILYGMSCRMSWLFWLHNLYTPWPFPQIVTLRLGLCWEYSLRRGLFYNAGGQWTFNLSKMS